MTRSSEDLSPKIRRGMGGIGLLTATTILSTASIPRGYETQRAVKNMRENGYLTLV
jgi:hypothetical protein